jgi:hypothetical protein
MTRNFEQKYGPGSLWKIQVGGAAGRGFPSTTRTEISLRVRKYAGFLVYNAG